MLYLLQVCYLVFEWLCLFSVLVPVLTPQVSTHFLQVRCKMILNDVRERFFYLSGAFADVTENPQKYLKKDLIHYFKVLGRLFDSPYDSLDSESIWRP